MTLWMNRMRGEFQEQVTGQECKQEEAVILRMNNMYREPQKQINAQECKQEEALTG